MKQIFFFGLNTADARSVANRMGFHAGHYIAIGGTTHNMRGTRGETMYVVGRAAERDDYKDVINEGLMRDFTIVHIDDEVLNLIDC